MSWVIPLFTPQELRHLRALQAWVDACRARGEHHDDNAETRRWRFWKWAASHGLISEEIPE